MVMIYEKSGLTVRRVNSPSTAAIVLDDFPEAVGLHVDTLGPALLTAEEARFLAQKLIGAALRLEKRKPRNAPSDPPAE